MVDRFREDGVITDLITGKQIGHTLMCCHCGLHWEYKKGSKRERGFCVLCMDITCGAHICKASNMTPHMHWREALEVQEREAELLQKVNQGR